MSDNLFRLIAAPFTPMDENGSLHLETVDQQAQLLQHYKVDGAFVCGTSGESLSLSVSERIQLAERWREHISEGSFDLIVHVGHNCLSCSKTLVEHAIQIEADAIASTSPTFFKPSTVQELVDYLANVASVAPHLPFYYYHIPALTGVDFSVYEVLQQAETVIPNLRGVKFTHEQLLDYGSALFYRDFAYDMLFGRDEMLLAALALGARGAVGTFYNFLSPLFRDIIKAYESGEMRQAQQLQEKVRAFTRIYMRYGGTVAVAKAIMSFTGIDCGPARSPLVSLDGDTKAALRQEIQEWGFERWGMTVADAG